MSEKKNKTAVDTRPIREVPVNAHFTMFFTRLKFLAPQLYPSAGANESAIPYRRGQQRSLEYINTAYTATAV